MTRFPSSLLGLLFLAGCASSSGVPTVAILEPEIAGAYIPLHRGGPLSRAEAAAVAIAPGIAVTDGHNRNLVTPQAVIGEAKDFDLLFFREGYRAATATAEPQLGELVSAYGQGMDGGLRRARGIVRAIQSCSGCTLPAYFAFAGDAGPGFSGGPVLGDSGRLIGITFGYRDHGGERLIFAYPMSRVDAELSALLKKPK
jgi:S1-C subfamily serine protease